MSEHEYTLAEFRANLRVAFNAADNGEPVIIERYGVDYYLVSKETWDDLAGKIASDPQADELQGVDSL